jgi:hypothetical protein
MRILFVLYLAFTITSSVFAHPFGGLLSYFHQRPAYEFREATFAVKQGTDGRYIYDLSPQKFQRMLIDSIWMKDYLSKHTYSFFIGDQFYMLSYGDDCLKCYNEVEQPQNKLERNLYLFRLDDSGWTIASDKPVQVDYEDRNSYISYFPWRIAGDKSDDEKQFGGSAKNGSVHVSVDGTVTIVLINHKMNDLSKSGSKIEFFNRPVVLKPKPDGTFNIQ